MQMKKTPTAVAIIGMVPTMDINVDKRNGFRPEEPAAGLAAAPSSLAVAS